MIGTQSASYGCTALKGTNKVGILRPDADGYYTVVVGALNFYNSAGAYYPLAPAKALFDESSSFQRRVKNGCLKGETGHPRMVPGMSVRDFMTRVMDIYEPNVCCHFRKIYLDYDRVKDDRGRPVVAIVAEVKPTGPMGPALKAAFENPSENVCFSIRSITNDSMVGGTLNKAIKTIVTFDWVTEPGISVATRWKSPSLESLNLDEDLPLVPAHLLSVAHYQATRRGTGFESGSGVSAESIMQDLGWDPLALERAAPPVNRW